jgi:F420-non-reducing hydrogenase large subunit
MSMSIKATAKRFIKKGKVSEGILNRIEQTFRTYDPCLACASHYLPGEAPLEVNLRTEDGKILKQISRGGG